MDDIDLGTTIKGFAAGQKIFGRYTLIRILGRGGMGVVWLARDDKLEREVALKFLPEVMMGDKLALADLKRETRRSLDLTHSHIVRIYDFVEDGRTAAIAMEYITGETLTNARAERPGHCYEPADIAKWVGQICDALDYAHAKAKVVHRDLKPANLMIDATGDVKVTDFGIATSIADSVSRVSKQAGSSGTPVYMAPQQMMGEKPAVTDDIYALGATLYDLLTGKPPFHSGNIVLQVQGKAPPPMADRREEFGFRGAPIPSGWEQTIAACLAKEPADRPQSAGEVAERLGLAAQGNAQRLTSNVERPRPKTAGSASIPKPAATDTGGQAGIKNQKSKLPVLAGVVAAVILLGALGWYFGLHVPAQQRMAAEQARLLEITRLDAEKRTDEANRLRTEKEMTEAEARRKIQLSEAAAKAEAERLANARGGLVVRTTPAGAEVRVGAIALDRSPLTLKEQKLGKYPVRIRLDGYEDWSGEVAVKENEFSDLNVSLIRSTGTLSIQSGAPGVSVILQGTAGEEPRKLSLPVEVRLPTGRYQAQIKRAGWTDRTLSLDITREQKTAHQVDYPGGTGDHWYLGATVEELKAAHEAGSLSAALWLGDRYMGGLIAGKVNYPEALQWYRAGSERNAGAAAGRLAMLSARYGEHISTEEGSLPLVRQAVQAGDPYGAWILDSLYLQHMDSSILPALTERQYSAALARIREDAEANDSLAMMVVAAVHATGSMGVEKNPPESIRLLRKVAETGFVPAITALGLTLDSGTEMNPANKQEALAWLERGVAAGDTFAMISLAFRLNDSPGSTAADKERAFKLVKLAVEQGSRRANNSLGYAYLQGIGTAPDKAKAAECFRKGMAKGDTASGASLAILYRDGVGVASDQNEYFRLSKWAALRGQASAKTHVGVCYHNGIAVTKDDAEALRWWRLAAEENESYALCNLGIAYSEGWGVTVDMNQAIEWWKKSAKAGNKMAQDKLTARKLTW